VEVVTVLTRLVRPMHDRSLLAAVHVHHHAHRGHPHP